LRERGFWIDIEHPELGASLPYPRQFAQMSEQAPTTRFRAPLIGEHNGDIYSEIGLTGRDLVALKQAGVI
jgi:crotonobetainyl-CoA:carnitine CoA-transferase CaiB-like acyl-CoA transferase